MQRARQLALWALHRDRVPVEGHRHAVRHRDRLSSDSRHNRGSLPDEGEEFAAGVGASRLRVRHEAARRAHNGHPETVADAGDFPDADVLAKPGARYPLELANDGLAALRVLED